MKKNIITLFVILALLLSACGNPTATPGASLQTSLPSVPSTETSCEHTDHNDDGNCDNCALSVLVALDFYSINDLHGKLADGDSHIGVDELTTYWKQKQETENVILLSAGDMWQGSAESNMTNGMILTDWMNELGFAAMTLGNHEYD